MQLTPKVKEILAWYEGERPGVKANLARILMHGRLGGTGKLVILPVDQGYEHGPARSFAPTRRLRPALSLPARDRCRARAYAAPLGLIEQGADTFAGQLPTILKVNSANSLATDDGPGGHRLGQGCAAAWLRRRRLHDLSGHERLLRQMEELREITARPRPGPDRGRLVLSARRQGHQGRRNRARYRGLCRAHGGADGRQHHQGEAADRGLVWRRRRRSTRPSIDRSTHGDARPPRHAVCSPASAWSCSRAARPRTPRACSNEIRQIRDGGGSGSIIGRNSFRRPKAEALDLLDEVIKIYLNEA